MPRKRTTPTPAEPQREPAGPLCVIAPNSVYDVAAARAALRLNKTTIRREVREGRLRVSCRAGRCYLLGEWLLDWLRSGPPPRRTRSECNSTTPTRAATRLPTTGSNSGENK